MKEFFGIDLTYDKSNAKEDGAGCAAKTISKELEKQLADASEQAVTAAVGRSYPMSKVPFLLRCVSWLFGIGMITILTLGIKRAGDIYGNTETALSLSQFFAAAKWHVLGAVVLFAAWAATLLMIAKKRRAVRSPEQTDNIDCRIDELNKLVEKELSVPENAPCADVLSYLYTVHDGVNRIKNSIFYKYLNSNHRIFRDDDLLCIVGNASRYEIPVGSIHRLYIVPDNGLMSVWTKPEPPSSERYNGIVAKKPDSLGRIKLYSCCVIEFTLEGEEYSMRFPAYEAPILEQLTGLKTADEA